MSKSTALSVAAALAFAGACAWLLSSTSAAPASPEASRYASGALATFAACLADKGAFMYGASWCPHCQKQKADFGAAAHLLPYVECGSGPSQQDGQTAVCTAAGIEGYPTWIFKNGMRINGELPFSVLAQQTGCALPESVVTGTVFLSGTPLAPSK